MKPLHFKGTSHEEYRKLIGWLVHRHGGSGE